MNCSSPNPSPCLYNMKKRRNEVNPKYVSLLNQAFEKYKNIDILQRTPSLLTPPSSLCYDEHNQMVSDCDSSAGTDVSVKQKLKKDDMKGSKRRKVLSYQSYKAYEDKVLVELIESAENKNGDKIKWSKIMEVGKLLRRDPKSIHQRIKKLKTGVSKREYKHYSFHEDCIIIDNAIINLRKCKSLQKTMLQNSEEIAQILKRNERSVYFRWTTQIRAWLLQYYKKSLNLEIRPMLANVLADNFESVDSIDWKIVMSFPEFSGFTESILSFIFSSKILSNASRRLGVKRSDLSLKEIAIDAEAYYKDKTVKNKRVETRQYEVIDYFEKAIKKFKISNFT